MAAPRTARQGEARSIPFCLSLQSHQANWNAPCTGWSRGIKDKQLKQPGCVYLKCLGDCGNVVYGNITLASADIARMGAIQSAFVGKGLWIIIGITQTDDAIWLVTFMKYDMGYFDETSCRLEPVDNPFNPELYTMSQE